MDDVCGSHVMDKMPRNKNDCLSFNLRVAPDDARTLQDRDKTRVNRAQEIVHEFIPRGLRTGLQGTRTVVS